MRIPVFVGHLMVTPMDGRPASRTPLQCRSPSPRKNAPQPTWRKESAMSKQAMVANADRKSCDQIESDEEDKVDWPRPKPKTKQTKHMQSYNKKTVGPIQTVEF